MTQNSPSGPTGNTPGLNNQQREGAIQIALGVGVFIVCSIVQGACGSSMFSSSYPGSDNAVQGLLANLTFYPGWLLTLGLCARGAVTLYEASKKSTPPS